jgi:hypothetical protein
LWQLVVMSFDFSIAPFDYEGGPASVAVWPLASSKGDLWLGRFFGEGAEFFVFGTSHLFGESNFRMS